ncbi:MAG: hypothetical protein J6O39_02665 [Treponema sp.]|nr:hypothetical protein [Treponema sp.]
MDQLELTALAVKKNVITSDEGAKIIWETVFTQRTKFALGAMDYDSFMDFLEYIQPKFKKILESYQPADGTFFSFLFSHIRKILFNWKKIIVRKAATAESYLSIQEIEYDTEFDKYRNCESSVKAFTEDTKPSLDEIKNIKELEEHKNRLRRRRGNPALSRTDETFRKEAVLILTLKACFDVTEDIIEKVSILTDMTKAELHEMVAKAKSTLSTKIQRRNMCTRTRDNAFFYHRKYSIEIPRVDRRSSWAEHLASRYERHTKIWEKANRRLNTKYCRLVPSTKKVAEILGFSVRHCEYILKKLSDDMDKVKLKWYPQHHENLPCKLKRS